MLRISIFFLIGCGFLASHPGKAQNTTGDLQGQNRRAIITAVPFLMITPDARSGALGDAGAALSPDANATHWNIGKLAFAEHDYGISASYNPWLKKIVDDMSLSYLSAYMKIDQEQAVSFSLRYFNLGEIIFTNENADEIDNFTPNEVALSLGYSRKLSDKIGLGVNARYIRSNLGEIEGASAQVLPANALAADIGLYSHSSSRLFSREGEFAWAAVISNIGNKITYLDESTENFMPGNLRLGTAYTVELDPFNKITLLVDANKLLVPTPPERDPDTGEIVDGRDPNRSLLNGTFTSFFDAPDGFSEELKEVNISTGVEYWYNELFAGRAGYFWEHSDKGGRKFFTIGVGLRYQVLNLDFAYLIPQEQNHPLGETLRFTVGVNLDRNSEVDRSIRQ